ncbi:MAG: (d)CMP kinase [Planctomycetes bacterium]|nr:(d)CMP kinase [Planctomycetota bacterium]
MAKLVITIDGPAGSGKSTVAKRVAKKLGISFLDTGAMYRAVTLAAMQADADMEDQDQLLGVLNSVVFGFTVESGEMIVSIDGSDVTLQIRLPEVTANVRYVASAPKIREQLVQMQREFADGQEKIVTEGRDQGTVAFPEANVKFFLNAYVAERAKRRYKELLAKGQQADLDEIQTAIEKRDHSDQNRKVGPLKPADDAVIIDTTSLSIDEVVEKLLDYIEKNA